MNVLDQLLSGRKVEVPVDGEQFPSSGFIGPVKAKMLWQFWSKVDLSSAAFREDVPQPFHREQFPDGSFRYFYLDQETGALAAKADPDAYNPQQVWYYSIPTLEVMNVDTGNFQTSNISRSCRVTTLRSKYRHEFHMVALPAIVASVAKVIGVDTPGYDLSELLVRDLIITPERSRELIGVVSTEKGFEAPYYEDSELWTQRGALWAALGEEDPHKYLVDEVDRKGNPHEYNTEAENLQTCLRVYFEEWEQPLYGRFQMVGDPRAGAVTKAGKRLSLPAITEIYEGAKGAQVAVDEDLKKYVQDKISPVSDAKASGKPDLPTAWESIGEEKWRVSVLPFTSMPKALLKEQYDPDEYDATLEEMLAWVEWEKKIG